MQDYVKQLKTSASDLFTTLKWCVFWVIIGVAVGVIVGFIGVGFHFCIDLLTGIRTEHWWVIFFMPLGGIVIVFLYQLAGMSRDKGTNAVLLAVREDEVLPFKTSVLIFISTVITHFVGGSSGREGAALQIGGSIAATGGRLLKFNQKQQKILVLCGMSACFSALFGTPVTAAIFSIEVVSVGIMHYSAIVPCVTAALTAFKISLFLGVEPTSFTIMISPSVDENITVKVIFFAVVCSLVCRLFCFSIHNIKKVFAKYLKNKYIRVITGSVIIVILTLIEKNQTFNGAGGKIITQSFSQRSEFYVFILKIVFTAITLGCGFKGGEIVPAFFVGASFGSFASPFLGIDYSFGAGIGLIAVFCGATNCPIASLLMSIELFGIKSLPFFALVCGVSYVISGDTGLYGAQKIMYSRTVPEFVNKTLKQK